MLTDELLKQILELLQKILDEYQAEKGYQQTPSDK